MRRKRILFLAEGATMLHFVRPLALASSLNPDEFEVHFYAPGRYRRHLRACEFQCGDLGSMSGERFLENVSRGKFMYPTEVLRAYVRRDRELISSVRPDLVIGDLRLTLPISARLEEVPCAAIINAYWSPYAKRRTALPELPITRVIPPRWLTRAYRLSEPLAFALHVHQLNRLRKEHGITPLPLDLGWMYSDGDHVLYPDIPELVATRGAPENHHYLGTCEWTEPIPYPPWWEEMKRDPRRKVFVSLGSSGPVRAMPEILAALAELPVQVLLSTSGRPVREAGSAILTAGLLPYRETAALSSLVISHGGSGGLYPSLRAGTPMLAIPSNADQHISTEVLRESGAGLGVRVEEASVRRLRQAICELLDDPYYRLSARHWGETIARYDSGELFRAFVRSAVGLEKSPRSCGLQGAPPAR